MLSVCSFVVFDISLFLVLVEVCRVWGLIFPLFGCYPICLCCLYSLGFGLVYNYANIQIISIQ